MDCGAELSRPITTPGPGTSSSHCHTWCSGQLFQLQHPHALAAVCGGLGPGGAPGTVLVLE
ncbi:hypothetical protein OIE62_06705 [Streptomyces scopuliridis]|uniref:Uncharacterized protein n=1 Tax=Streptomyces scopuliridis TaxID=452529 RepID=A0ACD4ZZT2_9ACTN|nr:hypothetical protein [Streptomyces scopuliridis]WSC03433.1 hypothetical protein OG835_35115 [Streptomyces scopuliridis]WSC11271.1 hypothetical protein OIE62_06705 [Streptomyces scopuliridis]